MEYRNFDKIDGKVSLYGVGTMRMPVLESGKLDHDKAVEMIRGAIDRGSNYVDTAWMYHDGESEVAVGKALKDGYREKVFLADKMPVWLAKDEEDMRKMFDTQLERLDVDCIDMYLVHNVTAPIWKRVQKLNCLEFLKEKKAEGKIKYIGFSFHDTLDLFKEVIDAFPWDFCQIQLNYMDIEFQAGVKGLEHAASKNIPVVVMEPLKGGKLVDKIPPEILDFWAGAPVQRKPVDWALRWVANFPQVMTILCGTHSYEQMSENAEILNTCKPNSLTEEEVTLIEKVSAKYNELMKYTCTGCGYCLPCPVKIDIPTAIDFCNQWQLYHENPKIKADYFTWLPKGRRGSDCINCKACEEKCPQHLPISNIMDEASLLFEK